MKLLLVFAVVLAVSAAHFAGYGSETHWITRPAIAAPKPVATNHVASSDQADEVTRYDNEGYPDGSYNYDVQISDGIATHTQSASRHFGGYPPVVSVVSQGSSSWTSPESHIFNKYVGEENEYQLYGDVITTPPPPSGVDESIRRAMMMREMMRRAQSRN